MTTIIRSRATLAAVALALVAAACGGDDGTGGPGTTAPAARDLTGVLSIAAGECSDAGVTSGSWFRMVQTGGTVEEGPFVSNTDSPCGENDWTPMQPGTDGGVVLGDYQPHPDPPGDEGGNGQAGAITAPTKWFGLEFALATNPVDPQTSEQVAAPHLTAGADGTLTGSVSALGVFWNGQHFNQGAPKPDGSGDAPTGTYDATTGAFTLDWISPIVGGPFNGFTGVWHLEGTLS